MDAVNAFVSGIKCDAKGCNYTDEFGDWGSTPEAIMATADKYLNTPCPLCGANLLTQADYNAVSRLVDLSKTINDIFGEVPDEAERVKVCLSLNGSGNVEFDTPFKE